MDSSSTSGATLHWPIACEFRSLVQALKFFFSLGIQISVKTVKFQHHEYKAFSCYHTTSLGGISWHTSTNVFIVSLNNKTSFAIPLFKCLDIKDFQIFWCQYLRNLLAKSPASQYTVQTSLNKTHAVER